MFLISGCLIFGILQAQSSFDCSQIVFESVKDTLSHSGKPAVEITLSTKTNTHNTGYTIFILTNPAGDTILHSGPHYLMPTTPDFEKRNYILELTPPHNTTVNNLNKTLYTQFPECTIPLKTNQILNKNSGNSVFNLYPNPFIDYINFSGKANAIYIYDLKGNILHELKTNSSSYIDLSWLQAGLYLFGNGSHTIKVIKT